MRPASRCPNAIGELCEAVNFLRITRDRDRLDTCGHCQLVPVVCISPLNFRSLSSPARLLPPLLSGNRLTRIERSCPTIPAAASLQWCRPTAPCLLLRVHAQYLCLDAEQIRDKLVSYKYDLGDSS